MPLARASSRTHSNVPYPLASAQKRLTSALEAAAVSFRIQRNGTSRWLNLDMKFGETAERVGRLELEATAPCRAVVPF